MFWIVSLIVIAADQISKRLVDHFITPETTIEIIPDFLGFTYIRNTGAAWSLFAGKRVFLILLTSVLLLALLAYVLIAGSKVPTSEKIALGLIFGGGLSNLISRIADGYVIDFINFYFIPIFNLADVAITCGCVLLALSVLLIEPLRLKRAGHGTDP